MDKPFLSQVLAPVWVLMLALTQIFPDRSSPFGGPVDRGPVPTEYIPEASGLEMSEKNPGILWTHNDSGDSSRIFALDTLGNLVKIYNLKGIVARDCEDIALGPGPVKNRDYLYLADIGDNYATHKQNIIYRFLEPRLTAGAGQAPGSISKIDKIIYRYPDGKRDAETLMIDRRGGDLYIVTKREDRVRLYRLKNNTPVDKEVTLEFMHDLGLKLVTAGDISRTTNEILLKTYEAVFYWKITSGESVSQTLMRRPLSLPYVPEPQGEGICWSSNGQGYYTISEIRYKVMPRLSYYPRTGSGRN